MKIENVKIDNDIIYATIIGEDTQIDTCKRLTLEQQSLPDSELITLIYDDMKIDKYKINKNINIERIKKVDAIIDKENEIFKMKNKYQEKIDEANNKRIQSEFIADQRFRNERFEILERLKMLEEKVDKLLI